ncbi:hypothetical protein [Caballeronia sp. Lep1P3]|uniref:hypothetical protein n=1 Tax=Caballeronia sp. Lep1P3 TaxID=2878150 RepID=UPI001FD29E36|nr:hypothetical protein [Caballeronia sp. Lep1P3]
MRKIVATLMAACFTVALTGCVSTDDALLKTVPIGSGTSTLATFEFIKCVKAKWMPLGARVREYGLGADSEAVSVPGRGGASTVLTVAQPSAQGTGYTIYGDIAAASRYVTATHACD